MLWGITPESWAQLWSGSIGATVAAFIGGLVALGVVRLTNRHQTALADRAAERAAIADLVASVDDLSILYREGKDAIQSLVSKAAAAAIRWELVAKRSEFTAEIGGWPYLLGKLAFHAHAELKTNGSSGEAKDRLDSATEIFRESALEWSRASKKDKAKLLEHIRLQGREFSEQHRQAKAVMEAKTR